MTGDQPSIRIEGWKGSDERYTVEPDRALRLQDVEWDERGGWERASGTAKILRDVQGSNPFAGQGKVNSLFWFTRHGVAQQFLLFELDNKLVMFNGSNNGFDTLKSDRYTTDTPWQRTQYAAIGDNVWILNGVNEAIRFDGRTCHKAGFDGPAPPLVVEGFSDGFVWGTRYKNLGLGYEGVPDRELIPGVQINPGEMAYGTYAYVLTEVNEYGTESQPSAVFASVEWQVQPSAMTTATIQPRWFTKVRIPEATNSGVVRRRLWRTRNLFGTGEIANPTFYLCADDLGGTQSIVHVDGLPDDSLGEELVPTRMGSFPIGAKYMAVFKGHAFYAGMTADPGKVVYSGPADIESVPLQNYFYLGDASAGEVTGMREFRNTLVVFKRRGIFMIMSDGQGGFQQKTVSRRHGCAAPNSIREVPGLGLVFVDDNGVWAFSGSLQEADDPASVKRIDVDLADTWKWKVNTSALMNAWADVHHRKHKYMLSIPYGGVPDNKMVLSYEYRVGAWVFEPNLNAACMTVTNDHRGYFFIGSNDDTGHPGVHHYGNGYATKDGVAIEAKIESGWFDLDGVYQHFTPVQIDARILEYGNGSLTTLTYKDRRATAINVGGQSATMKDHEYNGNPRPVWGTATWTSSAAWSMAAPMAVTFNPGSGEAGAVSKEFKVVLSSTSRCQFIGMRMGINPGPGVPILNSKLATGSEV